MRGLKTSTIVQHMSEAIKLGLPVDTDRLGVTERIVTMVTEAIRKPPINSGMSGVCKPLDRSSEL